MIETYVDLTYRGLPLGRRIKLAQVRPTTAYLELPAPMPVGSTIGILTDDTVALDAQVIEIHEQVGGADAPPGMMVRPRLVGEAAQAWWQARVSLPELPPRAAAPPVPRPPIVAATVLPKQRRTQEGPAVPPAVPEAVDEPHDTAAMAAVDPDQLTDDGKQTTMMDAVDLAALGLDPHSRVTAPMPTVAPADDDDSGTDDKPKKRKKKR